MTELHPHQLHLLKCISVEMKEQESRYALNDVTGLKQMRGLGVLLHPIHVTRRAFGYADYPEVSFRLSYQCDTSNFKDNSAIECFMEGEDIVKGVLLRLNGMQGEMRLFTPDFPDWIEDKGVGIKLAPDHFTSKMMKEGVKNISDFPKVYKTFNAIHGNAKFSQELKLKAEIELQNDCLNLSQVKAIKAVIENDSLIVLHGPPGTGKTTTLIEAIAQLVKEGKRVVVSAPSNTAVDNVAKGLLLNDIDILRVGNTVKVDDDIFAHTPEGRMLASKESKEIKRLKIKSEELLKMSYQYKRKFGKAERDQRRLLMNEVKRIRKEIRDMRNYFDEKLFTKTNVILGTPIGLNNFLAEGTLFDTLIIDEAGQSIEPMAWMLFPFAKNWVLAGDPFQLPPTVLSEEARRMHYNTSILESSFKNCNDVFFLNTQYRMKKSIADFSSRYFYDSKLITPESQCDNAQHVVFYDTAGTGFEEIRGKDGNSLMNEGELDLIRKIIEIENLNLMDVAIISPYSGQVQLVKEHFDKNTRISTIDSFQGQEKEVIILSLVRSNSDSTIGFLKDYRRMNVAMTRAKQKLFVIGDSSTIGNDPFYSQFLEYMDEIEGYRSAWELMS
ncbi:MAG: DNA2/NAM7 family helicase [Crocinitomicaceae bacterium]|nr:DNA2/NAM7 family helicase [Crocinitomicaceae bacterium]